MRFSVGIVVAATLCFVSNGCVSIREGESDYRRAAPPAPQDAASKPGDPATAVAPVDGSKTRVPNLYRKYGSDAAEAGSVIAAGQDTVSVHLMSAFVRDFKEGFLSKDGELAVVGNIEQMRKGVDFRPSAVNEGRLMYFSAGVKQEGQFLNFSALPIYGPAEYEGQPLLLEFHFIEIDATNESTAALLKGLAGLGAKAYPAGSAVLGVLEHLGSALFASKKDDSEFRYHMVLYPLSEGGSLDPDGGLPRILVGEYVIVKQGESAAKQDSRAYKSFDWSKVSLDRNECRLFDVATGNPWTANDYVVVRVEKGLPGVPIDFDQKFAALREELAANDRMQAAEIAKVFGRVESVLIRDTAFSEARRTIRAYGEARRAVPEGITTGAEIDARNRTADEATKLIASNFSESDERRFSRHQLRALAELFRRESGDNTIGWIDLESADSVLALAAKLKK